MIKINDFLKQFNIQPNDVLLFKQAFTHPSYSNELKVPSYQRLEFFGDAILQKAVTEFIFFNFPDLNEGQMSELRAFVVSGNSLFQISKAINLQNFIKFGNNKKDDLKNNQKVIEDVFEALIAAIYIDQDQDKLNFFLQQTVFKFIIEVEQKELKNPKTLLQEYLQLESRSIIEYETKFENGLFISKIFHDNNFFGSGEGKTKKESEIEAAKNALEKLKGK